MGRFHVGIDHMLEVCSVHLAYPLFTFYISHRTCPLVDAVRIKMDFTAIT
jgi:hypothetical protein